MRVSFVTCDVFTDRPFAGNPLLVVPDAEGLSADEMRFIAREINYSESTFVLPPKDPRHAYLQRTFVPVKEIPYAGHPTVGTAMVLSWLGRIGKQNGADVVRVVIEVGFGPMELELLRKDGVVARVRMTQGRPSWDEPLTGVELLGRIASGLDVPFDDVRGPLPVQAVSTGNKFLMLPLASASVLAGADPDPRILSLVQKELGVLGLYLFALEGERVRARAFCPAAGVLEDPATGSAAGPLGVYLALHGALPSGRPRFFIDQGIEMGRRSEIEVEVLLEDGKPSGVRVSGGAVKMMEGSLEI